MAQGIGPLRQRAHTSVEAESVFRHGAGCRNGMEVGRPVGGWLWQRGLDGLKRSVQRFKLFVVHSLGRGVGAKSMQKISGELFHNTLVLRAQTTFEIIPESLPTSPALVEDVYWHECRSNFTPSFARARGYQVGRPDGKVSTVRVTSVRDTSLETMSVNSMMASLTYGLPTSIRAVQARACSATQS